MSKPKTSGLLLSCLLSMVTSFLYSTVSFSIPVFIFFEDFFKASKEQIIFNEVYKLICQFYRDTLQQVF